MGPQVKWVYKACQESKDHQDLQVFKVPQDHLVPKVMLALLDLKAHQVVQEDWDHLVQLEFLVCVDQAGHKVMLVPQAHLGPLDRLELLDHQVLEDLRETLVPKELKDIQVPLD